MGKANLTKIPLPVDQLLHDKKILNILSQFSSFFHDKNGAPLPSKKQALFKRLKYRYDLRARIDKKETNYRTLMIFNRVCTMLDPLSTNIRNRAAYIYHKFIKSLKKGDFYNHLNLIAVCLYLAVKESKDTNELLLLTTLRNHGINIGEADDFLNNQLDRKLKSKFSIIFLIITCCFILVSYTRAYL